MKYRVVLRDNDKRMVLSRAEIGSMRYAQRVREKLTKKGLGARLIDQVVIERLRPAQGVWAYDPEAN